MNICGVELTGNDAVVSFLFLENGQFLIPECRVRKLALPKDHSREDLQKFQFAFKQLMTDYRADKIAIRGRMPKGKFAGGAVSFKLEAAIQLIAELDVVLLTTTQIKAALAAKPLPIPFESTELKGFQEGAFTTAYAMHCLKDALM